MFANLSVEDNVLVGAHTRLRAVRPGWPLVGPLAELALALRASARGRSARRRRCRAEAREILGLFGDRLLPRLDHPAYSLSYANRRRLEIARALALRPRLLLLDEPTAGMNDRDRGDAGADRDAQSAAASTILLIEHKLEMVMRLSDRVVVMDDGAKIAEGPPETGAQRPGGDRGLSRPQRRRRDDALQRRRWRA